MTTLKKLTAISTHQVIRDKSVKVIQYTSRILTGFYRHNLSHEAVEALCIVSSTCSLGRKAFRLLKSVNSLHTLSIKLAALGPWHGVNVLSRQVLELIEILEHFLWSLYFLHDNILFLGRTKLLVPYDAKSCERRAYDCWAFADLCGFVRRVAKLGLVRWDMSKIQRALESAQLKRRQMFRAEEERAARDSIVGVAVGTSSSAARGGNGDDSSDPVASQVQLVSEEEEIARLSQQLASLHLDQRSLTWEILRALCDLGVSGSWWIKTANGKWLINEKLGFQGLGEGGQGVCGVVSSLMTISDIIYQMDD